ncbi:outer membrane beta-barrel protein [Chitinophaga japonensis]|nr:outer membrane beta-barrel protein [Chitinophaga japonensis]
MPVFLLAYMLLALQGIVQARQAVTGPGLKGRLSGPEGTALEFATVSLLQASDTSVVKTVVSDAGGVFNFGTIPAGSYILHVSLIGYKPLRKPLELKGAATAPVDLGNLVLEQSIRNIKEVVVAGKKPLIERKLDKTVMNIENSLLATGSTAFELLQLAPGVTITNNDKVQLNGKSSPLIMIDGKPTYLSAAQVSNILKSMPSNTISEIEIISQPSAKYDAAGTAGIINVKTKQNRKVGFNGTVTGGAGYGRREKYRGGVNLNYKGEKINLTGDYTYSFNHSVRTLDIDRDVRLSGVRTLFDRSGDTHNELGAHNYKAGLVYFINKDHAVGLQLMGYANDQRTNSDNTTNIFSEKQKLDSMMTSRANEKSGFNNIGGNFNYRGKLDTLGRELAFDADYSRFRNNVNRYFINTLYDSQGVNIGTPDQVRNYFPTEVEIVALKADLVYPLAKKIKIEAGAKTSFVSTDNDARYDSLLNGEWKPSLSQTNHFIYKENVNAGYLNFSKEWSKTSLQAGVRVEQTNSDGHSVTLDSRTKRSYTNLFPSLFLSRKLSADNTLMFSYSKRIERPSYQDLNPFRFYDDRYTFREGNPYLKPAYTHSFEMTYSWKNEVTVVARYGLTNDVIAEDLQQDDSTNVTKSFLRNLEQLRTMSVSLSYSKDVTDWWTTDNTITFNRSQYVDDNEGIYRNFHNYDFNINIYQSFRLAKDLYADIGGFYLSPWLYGFIKAEAQYKLDIGLKKNLWNKKGSIRLRVSDVFYTNRFKGKAVYNNVDVAIHNRFESRVAFVTFTYLFGNTKLKVAKRNDSATREEKERVKKENQ